MLITVVVILLLLLLIALNLRHFLRIIYGKISKSSYSNYVIVITGCDSGFGFMLSIALRKLGFYVIASTLTKEGSDKLKNKVNEVVICDVTRDKDVDSLGELIGQIIMQNPQLKLWALVNNAGVAVGGCLDWTPFSLYERAMNVNYFGVLRMVKACLPYLKKTKSSRIINVSSMAGLVACGPLFGAYAGSKHALEGMTKSLRDELILWDIYVTNINPSFMKTPLIQDMTQSVIKLFQTSPDAIKKQYPQTEKDAAKMFALVDNICEDPKYVVQEIIEVCTDKYPSFNLHVGYTAFMGRLLELFPMDMQEWFRLTLSPSWGKPTFGPSKEAIFKCQSS